MKRPSVFKYLTSFVVMSSLKPNSRLLYKEHDRTKIQSNFSASCRPFADCISPTEKVRPGRAYFSSAILTPTSDKSIPNTDIPHLWNREENSPWPHPTSSTRDPGLSFVYDTKLAI